MAARTQDLCRLLVERYDGRRREPVGRRPGRCHAAAPARRAARLRRAEVEDLPRAARQAVRRHPAGLAGGGGGLRPGGLAALGRRHHRARDRWPRCGPFKQEQKQAAKARRRQLAIRRHEHRAPVSPVARWAQEPGASGAGHPRRAPASEGMDARGLEPAVPAVAPPRAGAHHRGPAEPGRAARGPEEALRHHDGRPRGVAWSSRRSSTTLVWLMLIFAVLGTVLPWIAVVMANDGPAEEARRPVNRYTPPARPGCWRARSPPASSTADLSGPPAGRPRRRRAPARRPAPRPGRPREPRSQTDSSPAANASPAPVVSTTVVGCAGPVHQHVARRPTARRRRRGCTADDRVRAASARAASSGSAQPVSSRASSALGSSSVAAGGVGQPPVHPVARRAARSTPGRPRPCTRPPRAAASAAQPGAPRAAGPAGCSRTGAGGRRRRSAGTSPGPQRQVRAAVGQHAALPVGLDQAHDRAGRRRPGTVRSARPHPRGRPARRRSAGAGGSSPTQPASSTGVAEPRRGGPPRWRRRRRRGC